MPDNTLTAQEKNDGFRLLFDGKTLDGWDATGKIDGWAVNDASIMCTVNGGGYCYTKQKFTSYILKIDFKIEPNCNSGIFFRWSDLKDPVNTGIEIQVLDTFGPERTGLHDCGAIYELVAPKKQTMKKAGEWNHVVLTVDGDNVSLDMNGENIAEMDISLWTEPHKNPDGTKTKFNYAWADLPAEGHIGLQDHGGKCWYKNIKIKEL